VFTMRVTHWPVIQNTIAAPTLKNVANQQFTRLVLSIHSYNNVQRGSQLQACRKSPQNILFN
jgi:hypothetical protein